MPVGYKFGYKFEAYLHMTFWCLNVCISQTKICDVTDDDNTDTNTNADTNNADTQWRLQLWCWWRLNDCENADND